MDMAEIPYKPKNAITATVNTTAITGFAGLAMSAVQNTVTRENVGAMGVFRRSGATVAAFTAMGAAYEFSRCASANLRHKDDAWNEAIGGFFGGAMLGIRSRTIPATLGFGVLASVLLGVFEVTGGTLRGHARDPNVDEFERKEKLRQNRRRPIQETIDELGEGRGIYAPGYAERRKERIKKAYGIDVPS